MDADFINVYISKQKVWIEDLLAKHIILEARVQILEKSLGDKNAEVDTMNSLLEEKIQFINKLVDTNNRTSIQLNSLANEKEQQIEKVQKKKKVDAAGTEISADEF